MTRIKVLFAIPALDHGGPDRVVFELLTTLDRERFEPSLMVIEPTGYYLSRLPPDVSVKILGTRGSFWDRYPLLRALRHVRKTKPDVVFATLRMTLTLGAVEPAFPRHTKLILRQANDVSADSAALIAQSLLKHRVARRLSLATLRRANAVVCQSTAMERDLRTLLGPAANLHVIGNPIDVERVTRKATSATLPGSPSLISVGRLASQKGFDLLLPAIARLRPRHPKLHLTILGDGPDRVALVALAERLGLSSNVTFAGFNAEPLPLVRAADLFVLASRYEGFPNAALEALACGTPVVLTDSPGANAEIIEPGINGRLASAIAVGEIVGALELAISELSHYDRGRIIADCDARFGSRRIAAKYEQVIASLVEAA